MSTTEKNLSDENEIDALEPEYHFDYSRARTNRFAARMARESVIVVLDPDVAEVFKNPETVNNVLRALIATMPTIKE
ncbi:MAG TPA: hypothetical protein P5526_30200 [Anaerolineae bacterium]|nr:hypothetical protein [Anaerolineae bacterium]MCB9105234.1 hypothetical protein [Anaerolineales bacterium]HRV96465.1 hypothetical protein [Anaerolineae bacterium]